MPITVQIVLSVSISSGWALAACGAPVGNVGAGGAASRSEPQPPSSNERLAANAVRGALAAGQGVFGENRVQEAAAKFPGLRHDYPDLKLHLIGPLQTNKVKEAVANCDVIETVDRPRLADALAREMEKTGRRL